MFPLETDYLMAVSHGLNNIIVGKQIMVLPKTHDTEILQGGFDDLQIFFSEIFCKYSF